MNINAYIIRDYIRNFSVRDRILSDRVNCPLHSFEILSKRRILSDDTIFIATPEMLPEPENIPAHTALMLLGKPNEQLLSTKADILYTEDPVSIPELVNALSAVFARFHDWAIEMQQCLYLPDPLQALGDHSLPYLRNPMGLYTRSFYIVRYYEQQKPIQYMYFRPDERESYILEDTINLLMLDPVFLGTWDVKGPAIFPDSTVNTRSLYQNINSEGKYSIRLVVTEVDSPIRDSDYPILNYVVSLFEQLLRFRDDIQINLHPRYLDESLTDCLMNRPVNINKFQASLDNMKWSIRDTYFCCDILSVLDNRLGSLDTACIRLENNVANSVALVVQDHILLLCNLSRGERTKQDILADLRVFFRENIFKVAVSREFSDLMHLREYYLQAKRALEIGQQRTPSRWFFDAEDYILTYILTQAAREFPFKLLCPQGLLTLMEYDAANNRDYTNVLKVYLECNMHTAEAVRKLYMQRQTFLYQLERIKTISGLNLDDRETRLHLLIAYQLRDFLRPPVEEEE